MQEQLIQCLSRKHSSGGQNSQQLLKFRKHLLLSSHTPQSCLLSFAKGAASEVQSHLQRSNVSAAFTKYLAVTFWSLGQIHSPTPKAVQFLTGILSASLKWNYHLTTWPWSKPNGTTVHSVGSAGTQSSEAVMTLNVFNKTKRYHVKLQLSHRLLWIER